MELVRMGKLYVVGIGPGDAPRMTAEARAALDASKTLCGYPVYIDLVAPFCSGKKILTAPMRKEIERCRMALEAAQTGTAALICSGDAGVYGLAGLALELAPEYPGADVEIVPGVTAALSGAALLGAPLGHDFCAVSLSDLLTPWEVIEKRLRCAADADFVICLYNPASRRRKDNLRRACDIILQYRAGETVCGLARNVGRERQSASVLTLRELRDAEADMFTTVFIGSSSTKEIAGRMVTPRGYPI